MLPQVADGGFRMLVWNVSRNQFFEHSAEFLTALRVINADLLILDEMPGDRRASDVDEILQQLNPDSKGQWQITYGSSGYNQRAVFAVRGGRVDPLPQFRHLPYPAEFVRWISGLVENPQQMQRLQADLEAGVGAYGISLSLQGKRLLAVGIDVQCCGDSDDAWQERRRDIEIETIREALDDAWQQRHPDAVIVAGDFNAVRGLRQVEMMQGTVPVRQLQRVAPLHANRQDDWTWDGRGTPFPSRPLDFVLHSRQLRVTQSLIFDPETMSENQQTHLGLDRELLRGLSEHRPVVVDFAWR